MNQAQPRTTLNHINLKNVESVQGFDSPQRAPLSGLGQPKKSVIIVQQGPSDSKSHKDSSKLDKQSHQEAALVNSQLIHLPVQTSQIDAGNAIPTLLQPVTHSQLQQHTHPTYSNNTVVQSTSIALSQLAKIVTKPMTRPPLPPTNPQRNVQTMQTNQISQQSLNKIRPQNRLSPPSRPSSSVPTVVHFNYQQTQQKQTIPAQQIQIVTFPTQNMQPVVVSAPIPGINVEYQQLSNQNNKLRQQIVLWQQRYFTVIQRFHFCYQRIQTITREYIIIQQQTQNCNDPQQLHLLKQRMASLEHIITQTQQELVEIVNRNKQVVGDTTNWKTKYQELAQMHSNDRPPQLHKLEALQAHLSEVDSDYKRVLALNEQAHQNQIKYIQQINRLNEVLSQQADSNSQDQLQKYRQQLLMKEDQVNTLRMIVEAQKAEMSSSNAEQYETITQKLNQQKNDLYSILKQTQEQLSATKNTYQQRIAQYEHQIRGHNQQIRRFQLLIQQRGKADSMQKSQTPSNNQLSHDKDLEILRLKHQLDIKQETQLAERKMFNSKIQQLSSAKESAIAILQQKANILQSDLNRKDSLIRSLRDKVYQLEQSLRIKNLDDKYQKGSGNSINNVVKASGIHSAQSHQSDKQLHSLRSKLKQQTLKLQQAKGQVSEYKRLSLQSQDALTAVKHENAMLKKQVDDLNYKINQFKETIRELEEGRKTYNELKVYSDGLKQALHQKDKQILILNHRVEDMELMQKQTTKIKPPQLAQLAQFTQITQQNQMLQASIYKKDLQISKLKQNNQLLQTTYDQLQAEFNKITQKKIQNDKQYQNEKHELRNKISMLQAKSLDYERKVAGLEEVRSILQQQLTALTSQLQVKIEHLQRSEIELKQQKSKNKTFQSEIESKMAQGEQLRIKLKQGQKKNSNLVKEVQLELDKKNEQLNSKKSELLGAQAKLFDLQTMLKTKQARIKELQKNNDNLKLKMGSIDSNLDQLKYLKHKISEYQSKVSALTYKTSSRLPNTQPTQIFERKVIYQLKLQNETLKQQLSLINRPTNDSNNDPLPKKELKERLSDFNQRLQEVIGEHFNGDLAINTQNDLFKKYQRDRRQLIEKYNEEITQLKLKILELQSQQPTEYKVTYSKGHYSPQSIYNEQIQFYREKNTQLQQRVQSHIKVNKDLKQQIQRLMRGHQDEYPISYYTQQLQKANELNTILQEKMKKANLQIKKLRDQLAKFNTRPVDNADYEIRISEMNRKISQLVLQINQLDKQKVELNQVIAALQQQLQKSKAAQDELRHTKEQMSKQLQAKQDEMLNQTTKLTNRIKLLQSQIQRLNQTISKRQSNQSAQLNLLRTKLNESQQQSRKLKIKIEESLLLQERNQREITKWHNQVQSLQTQIQRYQQQLETANRKAKEAQTEIHSLRTTISDYEGKLRSKQSQTEDHSYLQNQLNQQITKLKSQCALLSQQIQRVNQTSQKRTIQREEQILRARKTVAQRQELLFSLRQQLGQIKINLMKSNQAKQQVTTLQDQINRLNYALIVKNSDYQRREQEITDLNGRIRLAEDQIRQLRKTAQVKASEFSAIISRLQLQLKASSEKEQRLREIQRQYQQYRTQHNSQLQSLRAAISQSSHKSERIQLQLSEIIRSREAQISQLHLKLNQFQAEVQVLQNDLKEMHGMAAHIHTLQNEIARMNQYIHEQQQYYEEQLAKANTQVQYETTDRNNYESTISRLESTIHTLNAQIAELKGQFSSCESQRNQLLSTRSSLEIKITQLQQTIASLQLKITSLQQTVSTLQLQITNLHQTISVREQQYLQLNTRYEQDVSQLQVQLQNYRVVIDQLQDRLKTTDEQFNRLIRNSQYSIQFIRSVFISVQTQLEQKQAVHGAVQSQIRKGLEQCQRWNEIGL